MNRFTGMKDTDREVLKYVDDRDLLKICAINRKTWKEVCDDAFLIRRLHKYPEIEQYKKNNETWKQFFLRATYHIAKMAETFEIEYPGGDFEKQHYILQHYQGTYLVRQLAKAGELYLLKYLVEKGRANILTVLSEAAANGQLEIVKYIFSRDPSIPQSSIQASILSATENGHLEIVKYLVERIPDDVVIRQLLGTLKHGQETLDYLRASGL